MTSKLVPRQSLDLPFHPQGDFDHGDVYLSNGDVFIAYDSLRQRLYVFLPSCRVAVYEESEMP